MSAYCETTACQNWGGDGNVCPCSLFDLLPLIACDRCGTVSNANRAGSEWLCDDCTEDGAA